MASRTVKLSRTAPAAALSLALASSAAILGGCTVYASGTDEWDSDHHRARDESRPPPRSIVPVSLIGREVRVYAVSGERFFEGIVRDLGDWVRLETRDQRTLLIPREQIAYIEPVAPAATQP